MKITLVGILILTGFFLQSCAVIDKNPQSDLQASVLSGFSTGNVSQMMKDIADTGALEAIFGSQYAITARIPYFSDKDKIIAYEYIFTRNDKIVGSIYEALIPSITTQDDHVLFYTANFSLTEKLLEKITLKNSPKFFHNGCVATKEEKYCLPKVEPDFAFSGEYIDVPAEKYKNIEERVGEYFGTGGFYAIGERGYTYFDPRTQRVYDPFPGYIVTYDMLRNNMNSK